MKFLMKHNRIFLWSLICYLTVIMTILGYRYVDNANSRKETKLVMITLAEACVNYLSEYGSFESEKHIDIYEALKGKNRKEIIFLSEINNQDMTVDAWGNKIEITVNSDKVLLVSAGINEILENGKNDDISYLKIMKQLHTVSEK
jgi:hypothetical protein